MKIVTIKTIFALTIAFMLISTASGQSDDYYNDSEHKYSEKLVAGLEFTWEISKFSFEISTDPLHLDQATSTTFTSVETSSDPTTISADQTTTVTYTADVTSTTYTSVETNYPDFPDIKPGTTITIKLLQDLANYSQYDSYDLYDYQAYNSEFFEVSYSAGTDEEMQDFLPPEVVITRNTIVFENGTTINAFEQQLLEYQQNSDDYEDNRNNSTYTIKDGIAIQTQIAEDLENNYSRNLEIQYDIDTGLLVYVYANIDDDKIKYEIEVKLKSHDGIDINDIVANDDPTLSVPFSAIFVYTLILIPVIVNRIRKNS